MDEIAEVEPLAVFERWLDEAWKGEPNAHAMTLATATREGPPSARVVLLKGLDRRGFVFYTNLESRKSEELFANPHAALCFLWKSLNRQVRIEGAVEQVADDEADAYFATRPRDSQLGAWASDQSRPLKSRAVLERRVEEFYPEYTCDAQWGSDVLKSRVTVYSDDEDAPDDTDLCSWIGIDLWSEWCSRDEAAS